MFWSIEILHPEEKYADDEVGVWIPVEGRGPGGWGTDLGHLPLLQGTYADCRKHMRMNKLGDYLHKVDLVEIPKRVKEV